MKILLVQSDIQWNAREINLLRAEGIISNSHGADLIVLPEMFTTGFCLTPQGVAETAGTVTLEWMQRMARQSGAALAGSVATEDGGKYYNRFHFVRPDGSYVTYDKRHLFTFAGEHNNYTAGNERVVVEWCGVKILLQVCYDLRFPVFSRNKGDYDMIIYVASWAESRVEAWSALLRARAIENQCFVVGVNRVGDDPSAHYNGCSALIDFKGRTIVAPTPDKEEALTGEIDMASLADFRKKFPALNDADEFILK